MTDTNIEVIELELEQITIHTPAYYKRAQYMRRFINNAALAIVTGTVCEQTVYETTERDIYNMIMQAVHKFEQLNKLYSTSSTLNGVNEYLPPEDFTFRSTPNGFNN